MNKVNLNIDNSAMVSVSIDQTALLWALCIKMIPEKDWDDFLKLYNRKRKEVLLDMIESFPNQFDNPNELMEQVQKQLDDLKKQQ